MAHDVFLSYAEPDRATVHAICATLERRGIRCWYAPRDVLHGEDWSQAIVRAIQDAKIMVLVFSAHTNSSTHVPRELERAVHNQLHLIPFRIQNIAPSSKLEYYISTHHWLDAITPPVQAHIDKLAATITRLLADFGADLTPPRAAKPTPNRKWWAASGLALVILAGAFAVLWPRESGAAPIDGPKPSHADAPAAAEPVPPEDAARMPVAPQQSSPPPVPAAEDPPEEQRDVDQEAAPSAAKHEPPPATAKAIGPPDRRFLVRLHSHAVSGSGRNKAESFRRKMEDAGWNVRLFFLTQLPRDTFFENASVAELPRTHACVYHPPLDAKLRLDLEKIFPPPTYRYEERRAGSRQASDERDLSHVIDVIADLKAARVPTEVVERTWQRPQPDPSFTVRLHSLARAASGRRDSETFTRKLGDAGWNVQLGYINGRTAGYFENEAAASFTRKPLSGASYVFFPQGAESMLPALEEVFPPPLFRYVERQRGSRQEQQEGELSHVIDVVGRPAVEGRLPPAR